MSMEKKGMDENNFNHKLIIAGLAGMIEKDGLTFHETMEVLEDIKRQVWPALMQMSRGEG